MFIKQILPYYYWFLFYIFAMGGLYYWLKNTRRAKIDYKRIFYVLVGTTFAIQICLALTNKSNDVDMGWIEGWGRDFYRYGLKDFYTKAYWADVIYPPGYMPVLYVLAMLENVFKITNGAAISLLYKLPLLICDLIGGIFIFKIAQKKFSKESFLPLFLGAAYLLCPAMLIDSALWGQFDGILALLVAASLYCLYADKPWQAASLFTLSVLVKPTPLLLTPVFLFYIGEKVVQSVKKKSLDHLLPTIKGICAAVFILFFFTLLFKGTQHDTFWMFKLVTGTMTQTKGASLGAMNFYGMLGYMGKSVSEKILGMQISTLSVVSITLSLLMSLKILFMSKSRTKYISAAAVLFVMLFTFASNMHERYLVIILLTLLTLAIVKKSKSRLIIFISTASVAFFCMARALVSYWMRINTDNNTLSILFSTVMVVTTITFAVIELKDCFQRRGIDT